jgi:putative hydrolase of the HAD superfamily
MTKEIRSTNIEQQRAGPLIISGFGLRHSFGFRHSSFVICPGISSFVSLDGHTMTGTPRIHAVTFDVGGTLIHPWPSVGHVYAEVAARHGWKNLSPDELNAGFTAAWRAKKNFQHSQEDWADIVDRTFAGLCQSPPSQTFFPAIYERFAQADAWRIHEDVLPGLEALASFGIQMAVLSNWDERLRPLLQHLRLDSYFETIIVSCEVGFTKPSPVIFEQASKKLGIPPAQILHVGDSLVDDVAGAKAANFRALLIDRKAGSSSRVLRILSLRDLASLISNR